MSSKTENVDILFVQRNARAHGATSSSSQNDMFAEISHDLNALQTQLNDSLVPAMASLPDGTEDTTIDAFTNGIDGKSIYTNHEATAIGDPTFYYTAEGRPYTIYEQIDSIYTQIAALQSDLEEEIAGFSAAAAAITVADSSSLYTATNVEDALTEVMTAVNSLSATQMVLPSLTNAAEGSLGSTVGLMYYNTDSDTVKIYTDTGWKTLAFTV